MFTTFIVQPIFNLLVLIYALLPGHNFGLAIILFTIIVRLLLWPLVKRQLHQTKLMRQLQPELKRIKQETKGDRQKEGLMTMELYKARGINPFSSLVVVIIQLPILIALYNGLMRVVNDQHQIISFAYPALQHLSWMQHLAQNIHLFDSTLFGIVDLSKSALGGGGIYWPAMIIVVASAVTQYYQSKQLTPSTKDTRNLRQIMREAGTGKEVDQAEITAAMNRNMSYVLPFFIFMVTVNIASALSLYWFVGGLIAFIQQSRVLREDETEMEELADKAQTKDVKNIPEAEVVSPPKPKKKKSQHRNKRRKK